MIAHSMRLDELITKIQTVSGGDTQKKKLWGAKNGKVCNLSSLRLPEPTEPMPKPTEPMPKPTEPMPKPTTSLGVSARS
jgi:hypothetical protein